MYIIISFLSLLVIGITNLFTIHRLKEELKNINSEKYDLEKQVRLLQLKYDRAEELRKVKSGEIKKCRNCEYSQVVSSNGEEYEGTTDCQGCYVNSSSACYTGNYKNKFEDDWSNNEHI